MNGYNQEREMKMKQGRVMKRLILFSSVYISQFALVVNAELLL